MVDDADDGDDDGGEYCGRVVYDTSGVVVLVLLLSRTIVVSAG